MTPEPNPLEATLDEKGQLRMRVPPAFMEEVRRMFHERGIDMCLRPVGDGTSSEVWLRKLPAGETLAGRA